jgi:hypothetical protein
MRWKLVPTGVAALAVILSHWPQQHSNKSPIAQDRGALARTALFCGGPGEANPLSATGEPAYSRSSVSLAEYRLEIESLLRGAGSSNPSPSAISKDFFF